MVQSKGQKTMSLKRANLETDGYSATEVGTLLKYATLSVCEPDDGKKAGALRLPSGFCSVSA